MVRYKMNQKDATLAISPRDNMESKQKTEFTFRLMCSEGSLGLLGVGHDFPGQEIHLGNL